MNKKIIALLTALLLVSAGCVQKSEVSLEKTESTQNKQVEEGALDESTMEETEELAYSLEKREYQNESRGITIEYPEMIGLKGELLQDYMNQSLAKIVELYGDNESYSNVRLTYEVTRMDQQIVSVVYRGRAQFGGGKEFSILKSMNLDLGSSNEIDYSHFVMDDAAVRTIIGKKAVELENVETFEAEGIFMYFNDDDVVFYYMPLDDTADSFIKVPVSLNDIQKYIQWNFGEKPAS